MGLSSKRESKLKCERNKCQAGCSEGGRGRRGEGGGFIRGQSEQPVRATCIEVSPEKSIPLWRDLTSKQIEKGMSIQPYLLISHNLLRP